MRYSTFILALLTISLSAFTPIRLFAVEDGTPAGVELKGQILDAKDSPVSGATVMVWTAAVKQGYSTYCPSCYKDCGKHVTTDAHGAFALHNLSRDLKFRLLIVSEKFAPTFVANIDPLEREVVAKLQPRQTPANPSQVVRGRVVDSDGEPVPNAVIEPEMVHFKNQEGRLSGSAGAVKGLDPLAVSNNAGEFELVYASPAVDMTLMVRARGMAARRFDNLSTGEKKHDLKVSRGATVRGRLLHKGQPVSDAEIGLTSQSRSLGEYFREERIGTQPDGTFLFANVPAGVKWFAYAKMASIAEYGATDAAELKTTRDDEIVDVGDLNIKPGHRLQGQVILTDGQPIPDGMRIVVGGDRAWDSQTMVLPPNGRFTFSNLPSDRYSISPAVKGYRLSKSNPNLGWSIEGFLNRNIDDFVILLDPGKEDFAGRSIGMDRKKPLQSAPRP